MGDFGFKEFKENFVVDICSVVLTGYSSVQTVFMWKARLSGKYF